jgi:glutamine synthetase
VRDGRNLFHDAQQSGQLSELGRRFAAGWLWHAPALLALCAPTENSYRRFIVPDGPVERSLSVSRGAALCRLPSGSTGHDPAALRLKFCGADPSCNPYLALASLLLAGLDGIERREPAPIDGAPLQPGLPACLTSALIALRADAQLLGPAGVSPRQIDTYADACHDAAVLPVRRAPHPAELALEAVVRA